MDLKKCTAFCLGALVTTATILGPVQLKAQNTEPLRLATQELPPYHFIKDNDMIGIAVDRVRCVLDALDIHYEFYLTDWSEAQVGTETGHFDGFFVASYSDHRAKFSIQSDPIISESLTWYYRHNLQIDPNDPSYAESARYSAKFATPKWSYLHKKGYKVVMKPRDAGSLLNMLVERDVDVALESERVFSHFMAERGLSESEFKKIILSEQSMLSDSGVHFAKKYIDKNPLFLSQFNKQIQPCKDVGR